MVTAFFGALCCQVSHLHVSDPTFKTLVCLQCALEVRKENEGEQQEGEVIINEEEVKTMLDGFTSNFV